MPNNAKSTIFLISMSSLMLEILLTRLWSVTQWYHFAFVAISITMLGISFASAALLVMEEQLKIKFSANFIKRCSLYYSISMIAGTMANLCIPIFPDRSISGVWAVILSYVLAAIPFCFSGIIIAYLLTRDSKAFARLYAIDLLGAAVGCLVVDLLLKVSDGPTAVIATAILPAICALLPDKGAQSKRWQIVTTSYLALLLIFVPVNTYLYQNQHGLLRILFVKSAFQKKPLYEKWNEFSRVTVAGDPDKKEKPFIWGISPKYPEDRKCFQLFISVDGIGSTIMPYFDGKASSVDYLSYDITNIVNHLRNNQNMLIIGAGGGRDLLSALVFKQKQIKAIELNDSIVKCTNNYFGDFTGHLNKYPQVTYINDEARSYLRRDPSKYDIIQISFIETSGATTAGAYALTENTLYTTQAWDLFFDKLQDQGIISCTRWHEPKLPAEVYRLSALAAQTLIKHGIKKPANHIAIALCKNRTEIALKPGVATCLISKSPLSEKTLADLIQLCKDMDFELIQSPRNSTDSILDRLCHGENPEVISKEINININPPSDNKPYFFYFLTLDNLFKRDLNIGTIEYLYSKAQLLLVQLLVSISFLSGLILAVPSIIAKYLGRADFRFELPQVLMSTYFVLIGLAYMFVEVSQLQSFFIFLGHPRYALPVTLFSFLTFSGLGSLLADYLLKRANILAKKNILIALLLTNAITFVGYLFSSVYIKTHFENGDITTRIILVVINLSILCLPMGLFCPIGMAIAEKSTKLSTTWYWTVNGVSSVVGSVLALILCIFFGFKACYISGLTAYLVALACASLLLSTKRSLNK